MIDRNIDDSRNDITWVTGTEARVIFAPADSPPGYGELDMTHNGGRTWQRVTSCFDARATFFMQSA